MKTFEKNMAYNYCGTVVNNIVFDKLMEMHDNDLVFILDVRSNEEMKYYDLPYSTNIPLHKLPSNLDLIPKDKVIAIYCSQMTRATMAYTYLQQEGYEARIILENIRNIKKEVKPSLYSNHH